MADGGNKRVQVFGLNEAFVRQWGGPGAGPAQFEGLRGMAVVGDDSEVLICDRNSHRVQVFK